LVRSGNDHKLYINGTQSGSTYTATNSITTLQNFITIGSNSDTPYGAVLNGHIDEIRVSNTARYTANFTAPTTPFVNDANTLLLIHADGTDASTFFEDDNGVRASKGIQAFGNAQVSTAQSKFGGSSAAFDGTGDDIIVPPNLEHQQYIRWIKQPNDKYSKSQIACFFSHLSLWAHCAAIDKPIIILEHDAIIVQKLKQHNFYNCIQYLGNKEYYSANKTPIGLPPHGSIYNGHWRFMCRAHAYAIDPPIARNLLSTAIREGMTKTLDVFIRCDIFAIVQDGMYAYDERGISTIQDKEDYSEDA
jgi:hypothetical protein